MIEIIKVTAAKNDDQVVLWEVHEDHPSGEVWIVGDGQAYEVALTPRVQARLNSRALLRIEAERAPDDAEPIEGYDDMTATEIVALVDTLTDDEKVAIAEYEAAHKNRITVLKALE